VIPEVAALRLGGMTFEQVLGSTVEEVRNWLGTIDSELNSANDPATRQQLNEYASHFGQRLRALAELGLGYLGMKRALTTLSGGELHRTMFVRELGSIFNGVTYLFDEPTVGLHPADVGKLLGALRQLVTQGNTVILTEHDLQTIRAADCLVELGPGAGEEGGELIGVGAVTEFLENPRSSIAPYLRANRVHSPVELCSTPNSFLTLRNLNFRNLHSDCLKIPRGQLTAVVGISGSGKSTLLFDVIAPALRLRLSWSDHTDGLAAFNRAISERYGVQEILGYQGLGVVRASNSRVRIPRTSVARAVGLLDPLAELLANTVSSKLSGLSPASFRAASGQLPASIPAVVAAVQYRNLTFVELFSRSIQSLVEQFQFIPSVKGRLEALVLLGLGYLTLGESTQGLSSGERQRLKLVSQLGAQSSGEVLFLLDEPTAGLHPQEVDAVASVLRSLVSKGHTVVVAEHNPELVAKADYIIELGPGSGVLGGKITTEGTPGQLRDNSSSLFGQYLR